MPLQKSLTSSPIACPWQHILTATMAGCAWLQGRHVSPSSGALQAFETIHHDLCHAAGSDSDDDDDEDLDLFGEMTPEEQEAKQKKDEVGSGAAAV